MDKNDAIGVIDSKIVMIKDNNSYPGWTLWGALAAFAGVIYLLLEKFEVLSSHLYNFYILAFIVCSIILSAVKFILDKRNSKEHSIKITFVERYKDYYGSVRRLFIFKIILIGVLLFSLYHERASYLIMTYFIFTFIIYTVAIIATLRDTPVVKTNKKQLKGISVIKVLIIVLSLVVYFFMFLGQLDFLKTDLSDKITVSLLMGTLLALFFIILKLSIKNPLMDNLREIKEDLLYGNIEPKEAERKIELVLYGLRLRNFYKRELSDILSLIHEITNDIVKESKYWEFLKNIESQKQSEDTELIKESYISSTQIITQRITSNMAILKKEVFSFKIKLNSIVFQCSEKTEIYEIIEMISNELLITKQKLEERDRVFNEFNAVTSLDNEKNSLIKKNR